MSHHGGENTLLRNGHLRHSYSLGGNYKRQRMTLLKPFFILFNIFAGIAFFVIVFFSKRIPLGFYI